ncbi:hypothetical protein [Kitasatospora acidiphila]|uniref:hypothetical protein n=1 Tax=Kitasatospora acidiphila TaxID=2567942 RepID=UPI003C78CF33
MVDLPEEQQAVALREVAEVGAQRSAALAEAERLTEPLRAAAVNAARAGANRNRIRELAGVSSKTLYGWLESAGLEIRPKRPAKERHA